MVNQKVLKSFQLLATMIGYPLPEWPSKQPENPTPLGCGYLFKQTSGVRVGALRKAGAPQVEIDVEFYREPTREDWLSPEGREACSKLSAAYNAAYACHDCAKVEPVFKNDTEYEPGAELPERPFDPNGLRDPETIYHGESYAD